MSNHHSDTKSIISAYFYEIAHSGGEPTRFQSSGDGIYYTADQLREDLKNREPIKLAILCSCEAMQSTNQGTLSYEFRKGQIDDTITIGYLGMGGCPGWYDSLDWQDAMFSYIDRGYTVRMAFDLATALYPRISDCVKYVGDNEQRIVDNTSNYILMPFIKFKNNKYYNNLDLTISNNLGVIKPIFSLYI